MSKFLRALGDFVFLIVLFVVGTYLLSYFDIDITNRISDKIGSFNIINVYSDTGLNGLLTLGIALAIISFVYDIFFRKEKQNDK